MNSEFYLSHILKKSSIKFGTSGARGLVQDFTDDVCAAYTQAFIRVISKKWNITRIAIGMDLRPSSESMVAACASAARALNIEPEFYGVLPTPALAYFAISNQMPAIMVTGSHIPFDRNGMKFYRPDGEITKEDEELILAISEPLLPSCPSLPTVRSEAVNHYVSRYKDFYPGSPLTGKRIGIYLHSCAGRSIYPTLFRSLGAEVIELEPSDQFVPIDTEDVSVEDKKKGRYFSENWLLDAIFSTDGDGDRALLADEFGEWLRGDVLCMLAARSLGIDGLAVPVSCNSIIEKSDAFNHIIRTKIGSPYVISAFENLKSSNKFIAGFEANGGFILESDIQRENRIIRKLPTRDALLPALEVIISSTNSTISSLLKALPQGVTLSGRIQQIDVDLCKKILFDAFLSPSDLLSKLGFRASLINLDVTDGWRCSLNDNSVIHLRLSGNAPELRIYVEDNDATNAGETLRRVIERAKKLLNNPE